MLEKLKDIKDIVKVVDYSYIYLILLCVAILLLIIVLIYRYIQPKRRKKPTKKELALVLLKGINFNNQKEVAYKFSLNAVYFVNETNKDKYNELAKKLEPFKYKKEIPLLEDDLKNEIENFIEGLK